MQYLGFILGALGMSAAALCIGIMHGEDRMVERLTDRCNRLNLVVINGQGYTCKPVAIQSITIEAR